MWMSGFYGWLSRVGSWAGVCAILATVTAGCSGNESSGACLAPLPRAEADECDLAHAPEFDVIYQQTFNNGTCGVGSQCHTPDGATGGLVLTGDPERAYDMLLGGPDDGHSGHDHALVIPGDPECSELMRRLESDDTGYQMPPGSPLPSSKRCAITQWIANGAER